ncbi:MAG: dihydroxyacetone kinase subunit L [Moraxellaceae bacterium]|nr:dihydroxyacetone kinase subunit L [Moraxellaceae bacterium]
MLTNDKLHAWLQASAVRFENEKAYLTDLDSAIGDADHGINMARGFTAVASELDKKQPKTLTDTLKLVAMTLIKNVGGASGPLYGTLFLKMSLSLKDVEEANAEQLYQAFQAGYQGLLARGKASVGDKTMLDVWSPALQVMEEYLSAGNTDVASMLQVATEQADKSAKATIPMLAKKGRASYLGERSIGHQDAGATSSFYLLEEASKVL